MFAPHTVTVYYAGPGEAVHVTVLEGVLYDGALAAGTSRAGMEGGGGARLFIPNDVRASDGLTGRIRVRAGLREFLAAPDKSGLWSLGTGERWFFAPGRAVEPEGSFQRVNSRWGAHRVTRVRLRDFGSPGMGHWEAEGA